MSRLVGPAVAIWGGLGRTGRGRNCHNGGGRKVNGGEGTKRLVRPRFPRWKGAVVFGDMGVKGRVGGSRYRTSCRIGVSGGNTGIRRIHRALSNDRGRESTVFRTKMGGPRLAILGVGVGRMTQVLRVVAIRGYNGVTRSIAPGVGRIEGPPRHVLITRGCGV